MLPTGTQVVECRSENGQPAQNLARAGRFVDQAAERGADLGEPSHRATFRGPSEEARGADRSLDGDPGVEITPASRSVSWR